MIGAWTLVDRAFALKQARACDQGPKQGALHGLPFGVKDVLDTSSLRTAYGSPIYRNHLPRKDASAVARSRAAGGVLLGKTVTTEFAYQKPGRTVNPHDVRHTPGGSSSGSAAAVADRMVPFAFGTQTGGSVIRPAAYCGVVGFKPSYDAIERAGVRPLAASLDTVGVLARTVDDAALLAGVAMAAETPGMPPVPGRPRIGICRTAHWDAAEPPARQALDRAADAFARAGADIREVELPENFEQLNGSQETIMAADAAKAFAYEVENHEVQLSPALRALIARGLGTAKLHDIAARALAVVSRERFERFMRDWDMLLTPAATGEAPEGLRSTGSAVFNRTWTLLHVPCIALPYGRGPRGLPLAIQLVGTRHGDWPLLALARWAEAVLAK